MSDVTSSDLEALAREWGFAPAGSVTDFMAMMREVEERVAKERTLRMVLCFTQRLEGLAIDSSFTVRDNSCVVVAIADHMAVEFGPGGRVLVTYTGACPNIMLDNVDSGTVHERVEELLRYILPRHYAICKSR